MRRNGLSTLTLAFIAMAAATAGFQQTTHAALVYLEEGGRVTAEAEYFSSRSSGSSHDWLIVPTEDTGPVLDQQGNPVNNPFLNARAGRYVQVLPDTTGGNGGTHDGPTVEFTAQITDPGTYRLYVRADGMEGNSDSLYARRAGETDYYRLTLGTDENFATNPWQGSGKLNTTGAAGGNPDPVTFNLAAGEHTFIIDQREDGAALDAIVLQKSTLGAPTGDGPNSSTILGHSLALTPTEDAYVRLGTPTQNYGGDSNLWVKNSGTGSTTRKSYIKFDVSTLELESIADAKLMLEVKINNSGGNPNDPTPQAYTVNVWGLDDGHAGEGWDESLITWNTAPANDTADNDLIPGEVTFLGQFVTPLINPAQTPDPVLVDLTNLESESLDALLTFLRADTDGQVTFILNREPTPGNNLTFASKESAAMAPTLSLFYTIPEPGTIALLSLAACGVGGYVRKRRRA